MDKFMGINLMFFYIGYYILVVLLYMYVWWWCWNSRLYNDNVIVVMGE